MSARTLSGIVGIDHALLSRIENGTGVLRKDICLAFADALDLSQENTQDLLDLILVQDKMPNLARDVSGLVIGRKMQIPASMKKKFLAFVSRTADAAKKARKTIRELDELFETGFRGAEAELVASLVNELDQIENDTDALQAELRNQLFDIESELPPVDVMFLYREIELIGEIGDMAERIGRRLELMLNH